MLNLYPDDWKHRYKRDYLRTLINRQRMANEQRFISATELDNMIANKMQEMGKVSALKAMQQLIDEIHEKNQRKKHIL